MLSGLAAIEMCIRDSVRHARRSTVESTRRCCVHASNRAVVTLLSFELLAAHHQCGDVYKRQLQSDASAAAEKGPGRGRGGANSEATPIVVNGVMYLPAASSVVALEPESGKKIWEYSVTGGAPSRRGVAYWPGDKSNPPRILFTVGRRLIALNANTGKVDPAFGKEGELDMVVPYNSVPLLYKNVVVVGANTPAGPIGAPGNARAFDARTGAKLWEFSSVAQPGQPGHDSWEDDSWKNRSGVNAWPFYFSVDERRGLVYLSLIHI